MTGQRCKGERGAITFWILGLCVCMLFLGGISLDLWRVFSERRALAAIADAAALAGTSGIDQDHFRATGEVILDEGEAVQRADQSIRGNESDFRNLVRRQVAKDIRVIEDDNGRPTKVRVRLTAEVQVTLLRVLSSIGGVANDELQRPFEVSITSDAEVRPSE